MKQRETRMRISSTSRIIGYPSEAEIAKSLTSPSPVMPAPRRVVVDWPQGVVRCEYDTAPTVLLSGHCVSKTRWHTMQLEGVLQAMATSDDMA